MYKKSSKLLALFLSILMCVSLLPIQAFAAGGADAFTGTYTPFPTGYSGGDYSYGAAD